MVYLQPIATPFILSTAEPTICGHLKLTFLWKEMIDSRLISFLINNWSFMICKTWFIIDKTEFSNLLKLDDCNRLNTCFNIENMDPLRIIL